MPTLIAVAHGTRSPAGQAQIRDLVARVARRGLDIRLAYVDVQEPKVAEVVQLIPDAVVVPLLLSAGYHVRVDIAEAVAGTSIPVTAPLGPDDVLLESLLRNLRALDAGLRPAGGVLPRVHGPVPRADAVARPADGLVPPAVAGSPAVDAVVVAAAGSSDPAWRADVEAVADQIRTAYSVSPRSLSSHRLPHPPWDADAREPTPFRAGEAESSTGSSTRAGTVDGAAFPARVAYKPGVGDRQRDGYSPGPGDHVGTRSASSPGHVRDGYASSPGRVSAGQTSGDRIPVRVGYVSGPGDRVPDVVAKLRREGAKRIAVAAYLLADGLFYRSLRKAGADHVTPPLCLDPAVTELVVQRYLTTAAARL